MLGSHNPPFPAIASPTWCQHGLDQRFIPLTALTKEYRMRLLIALIFPWLTFFTIGRPIAGIICLILQITVLGWIPATIWAVYALSQYQTDKKIAQSMSQR